MEKQETNKNQEDIKQETNQSETKQNNSEQEKQKDKSKEFFKKVEEVIKANETLTEENKTLKEQLAGALNSLKELQKDFDNLKSRTKDEIAKAKKDGILSVAGELFTALDAFKKAKKIITDRSSISGINLIEKNILTGLEKQEIKKISCKGKKFNPDFHDAVLLVEDKNVESGTIIDEIEAGFTFGDKVVKYCKVTVAK